MLGACLLALAAQDLPRGYTIPIVDISSWTERQVVVDREAGQYLGHPTTLLLEDGRTLLCVYPKGHGRGGIVYKRSTDAGLTRGGAARAAAAAATGSKRWASAPSSSSGERMSTFGGPAAPSARASCSSHVRAPPRTGVRTC